MNQLCNELQLQRECVDRGMPSDHLYAKGSNATHKELTCRRRPEVQARHFFCTVRYVVQDKRSKINGPETSPSTEQLNARKRQR
jgi:hypothetical protein